LTAPEYQLVSYAASKTRARGVNAWMREAVATLPRADDEFGLPTD
jgi:hypothetical protein